MNKAQRRFLELLAGEPRPTRFQWIRKPYGEAMKATVRIKSQGKVVGYKVATLPKDEHRELVDGGFVKACMITAAGRAALSQ